MNISVMLRLIKEPNIYVSFRICSCLVNFISSDFTRFFSLTNEIFPISIFILLLLGLSKVLDNLYIYPVLCQFFLS